MDFPSQKLAFSIEEVAELTGLGRTNVYANIASGRLIARKVGLRRTIVTASDLAAFISGLPTALEARTVRKGP